MLLSVAVAGASGYAGGELLRLLQQHPNLDVRTVTAHSNVGELLQDVQPHLRGYPPLRFVETSAEQLAGHDVVFLALPHGASGAITEGLSADTLVVDCGADHRLESVSDWDAFYGGPFFGAWEYGVPELPRDADRQRERLRGARRVAAPGCNASAVALAFAPAIAAGLIDEAQLTAVLAVGPSGAGKALKLNLLAAEVLGNASPYAVAGTHRHIPEIAQSLRWAGAVNPRISFTPVIVPMSRGILATCTAPVREGVSSAQLRAAFESAYAGEPFVQLLPDGVWPRTADTAGANTALIGVGLDEAAGRAVVIVALDNLVKGTAGAAIQSANIALGFPETLGLPLDGVAP
ncbi:MAG TPA: N-acetyl-gamma-glutamyl-phosphate reductase [Microbacteriaceae bacterium]|nr:N-acetyl-gamma-glutamyl-phosphate reductase [Microbacteriaceae bacterium]